MIKIRIKTIEELKKVAIEIDDCGDMSIDDDVFIVDNGFGETMEYLCGKEVFVNNIDGCGNVQFDGWNLTSNMYTVVDWEDIIEDYDVVLMKGEQHCSVAMFIDGALYFYDQAFKSLPLFKLQPKLRDSVIEVYRTKDNNYTSALRGDLFDMDLVWHKRDTFEYVEVECYLTGGEVPIYAVTTKEVADKIDMTKNVYVTVMDISECGFDDTEDKSGKYIAGIGLVTPVESTKGYDWKVDSVIEL